MAQPDGFVVAGSDHLVCRLQKALYGLKWAPWAWLYKLKTAFLGFGFLTCKSDSSLYILHSAHQNLLVLVYVDDIIITLSSSTLI